MRKKIIKTLLLIFLGIGGSYVSTAFAQMDSGSLTLRKPADYEYLAGEKVGFSLLKKCAMLDGIILSVRDNIIEFSISEKVGGEKLNQSTVSFIYKKPDYTKPGSSKWSFVNISAGSELIVFYCSDKPNLGDISYVTSEQSFFPRIKKAVRHYSESRDNPELLKGAVDSLKKDNDSLFLGYIVESLSRAGSKYPDYTTLILSKLLDGDNIPPGRTGFTEMTLIRFLSEKGDSSIKTEARRESLRILISLAGSNKKSASTAIDILASLVEQNKEMLDDYLDKQSTSLMIKNLESLPPDESSAPKERREFLEFLKSR